MKLGFVFVLVLLSACKKTDLGYRLASLIPLEHPVVYARYETLPALLRSKPGPCKDAFSFKAPDKYQLGKLMDLCGPLPQKAEIVQKTPWLLYQGFKSIHWEQDLEEGEKLQLELMGPSGTPLPSSVHLSKTGSRIIAQLKATENLPKNVVLVIKATLLNAEGTVLTSWSTPFKITGN
ncbi:MAG: hypothetical protein WCK49_00340 [Myxococcaceae bacterium]